MRSELLLILRYVPLVQLLHMLDKGVLLPLFIVQLIKLFGQFCILYLLRVEGFFGNLYRRLVGILEKFSLKLL